MFRRRSIAAVIVVSIGLLFLIANRGSYKGYFTDDDLNALSWAKDGSVPHFLYWLILPRFHPENFRPVGAFYYRILGGGFGLEYRPYVAGLQIIHLCNVIVLYLILRRLMLPEVAAAAGALFYLFNAATLEIYWKPMYVYDLLCGTFCLLTLLLYIRGNWILGLITFWLAYKSKEVAVMLPLALLSYELLEGRRRWKQLIPYFVISLNFGLQELFLNPNKNNDYTMTFTFDTIWKSWSYYSIQLLFVPYALILAAIVLRDRRIYLGLMTTLVLLIPMLLLPGRQFAAYWYVPLIGLAVAAATLSPRIPRWALICFFAIWSIANYAALRQKRKAILAAADDNRIYVAALADYARQHPEIRLVGYDGRPPEMHEWGIEGAVHLFFGNKAQLVSASSTNRPEAVIHWTPDKHVWVQRAFGP